MYNQSFLQRVPYVMVSSTIVCYMLYTVSAEAVRKFATKDLIYTTPFVVFGIFRYMYLVYINQKGENTTEVMITDPAMIVNVLLYILTTTLIIY